jgi:ABC-type multidrug transport system fused ATPase/permease subunit
MRAQADAEIEGAEIEVSEIDPRSQGIPRWRRAVTLLNNRQRILFAFLTAARIAVGFCDLALAAAMYLLFLLLQGRDPAHSFWWTPKTILAAALLAAILVVVRACVDVFSSRSVFRHIQNLSVDFLLRLTRGYSEMQWVRFVERNRSELMNHALHTAREAADFYHRCIELTAGVVIVVAMAAAFVYQSATVACGFACALAAFYCVHRLLIRRKVQEAASNREKSLTRLQRKVADLFASGKEVRTYGNQAIFHDRLRREAEGLAASHRRAVFLPQVARILAEQGTILLFLTLIVAVQLRQGDTRQLLSLLAFYFVLSRRLLPLVSQISLIAGQMESSYENVRIIDAELNECRRYRTPALPARPPRAGFVLELDQVSFWFHEDAPILQKVSLCLGKGETVALHGASGIGKSSLLNLIAGVLQPMTGDVRIDRAAIAYVPQEIPLLDDTIRNNLLFGLPPKRDEELMRALAAAKLADLVAAQPLGLETRAGDNGVLFSGGQRQRLGLARAILRGSQLLLLDEATSALDEETERQVLENLRAAGTAVFLVTHRLHAHRFAQRVYRLQDGCLVEEPLGQMANDSPALLAGVSIAKPCRNLQPRISEDRGRRVPLA